MKKNSGFTLMEVMVTVAIIGILAAVAIPPLLTWRQTSQFVGAVQNLTADLQRAKLMAVKENGQVQVTLTTSGYTIILDSDDDDVFEADETIRSAQMPAGVSMTPSVASFIFVGTGTVPGIASEVSMQVDGAAGRQGFVRVNMLGRISQTM